MESSTPCRPPDPNPMPSLWFCPCRVRLVPANPTPLGIPRPVCWCPGEREEGREGEREGGREGDRKREREGEREGGGEGGRKEGREAKSYTVEWREKLYRQSALV